MKISFGLIRLILILVGVPGALQVSALSAQACKGKSMILNKKDGGAVTFCYDPKLKAYLSSDCFKLVDGKACEIRSVIALNRYNPVKLTALELQTSLSPDETACQKLKQKVRTLIDSEGDEHHFCESAFDGSLAPPHLIRWRT